MDAPPTDAMLPHPPSEDIGGTVRSYMSQQTNEPLKGEAAFRAEKLRIEKAKRPRTRAVVASGRRTPPRLLPAPGRHHQARKNLRTQPHPH